MRKLTVLIAVAGLGLLAACGSDGDTASDTAVITDDQGDDAEPASGGPASVADSGITTYENLTGDATWANVGALIQSNSDKDLFLVQVTYDFIGADGTTVATETSGIEVLPAGEVMATSGTTTTDLTPFMPVTLEVTAAVEEDSNFKWAEMDVAVTDPTVVLDEFGVGKFAGTVTNTTETVAEFYAVQCVVVDPDDNVIGGIAVFGDTTAPGETFEWTASGTTDYEALDEQGGSLSNCRTTIYVD